MSSTTPSTTEIHPSTSFELNNVPKVLYPKEPVACMNCPIAMWMFQDKIVECYCRILYRVVWETSKPGRIRVCDGPEQLRLAAQARANASGQSEA